MSTPAHEAVEQTMRRINRLWLEGDVDALGPMVDSDVVMVVPGFTGRVQGREPFLKGFRDFCLNAKVHSFTDSDYQSDVIGDSAVATFRYEMVYEWSGARSRAVGRDLWMFRNRDGEWIAVWRAMLESQEQPA